jgi:hypothetical protein
MKDRAGLEHPHRHSQLLSHTHIFSPHSSLLTTISLDAFYTTITAARPIHDGPEEETIDMSSNGGYCVVSARPVLDVSEEETVNMSSNGGYCVIA